MYEAAQQIKRKSKPVKIFYVGDHDPAGVLIDVAAEKELRGHLDGHDLDFQRIAITPKQISEYGLPGKPRKEGDRRALHIQETVDGTTDDSSKQTSPTAAKARTRPIYRPDPSSRLWERIQSPATMLSPLSPMTFELFA